MTTDEFFEGHPKSKALFDAVRDVINQIGAAEVHVMKSQIEFRRKKNFAWVWVPGRTLRGKKIAPLVLTLSLNKEDPSPRWKQIVQTSRRRYTHHLELFSAADLDDQVRGWLQDAWKVAK